jgi:hypothetical protein
MIQQGAARITRSVKGLSPSLNPGKSQPPALPVAQVSSGGLALSHDRAWGEPTVLGSDSWDHLTEDGDSENVHGKDRSGSLRRTRQSCPAARIVPLAAEGPNLQRGLRV